MQTDGWKPGPPPLDTPGRYDCIFGESTYDGGRRIACTVEMVAGDRPFITWDDGDYDDNSIHKPDWLVDKVLWHFPIPDPPETET